MCVQDRLASLGISYVLSVSRCSPQPSFLPRSRFLRIPIDDSLWDDLLPWIPQALSFIGQDCLPLPPKHLLHSFLCYTTMLMLAVDWFFSLNCASWISHTNVTALIQGLCAMVRCVQIQPCPLGPRCWCTVLQESPAPLLWLWPTSCTAWKWTWTTPTGAAHRPRALIK